MTRTFALSVLFTATAILAAAGARAGTDAAPESLFPKDERLTQPVSVRAGTYYLGELLDQIGREAKVPLEVSDARGAVSGIQLIAAVKMLPLRQVMGGLAELLSHRFDRWEWQAAPAGKPGYRLRHQQSPQEASEAARREVFAKWSADVRAYHEIARLPDQSRSARAGQRPDLFLPNGVNWGLANLLGEVSDADLEALLQGHLLGLNRAALSSRGQKAYDTLIASNPPPKITYSVAPGVVAPPPQPVPAGPAISFHWNWETRFIGPVLWCQINGNTSTNVVGGGGWDMHWRRSAEPGWRDWSDPAIQAVRQKWTTEDPATKQPLQSHSTVDWVRLAASKHGLNVLVDDVYPQYRTTYGGRLRRTAEEAAVDLTSGDHEIRQHGELYLARHISAMIHPRGHLVAWAEIKRLRESAERNRGYLGFQELLWVAGLNQDQLAGLGEEFPDANPEPMAVWRPILQFYQNLSASAQQAVRTTAGLPYQDAGVVARRALESDQERQNERGMPFLEKHGDQVRISLRMETGDKERQLVWELRAPGTPSFRARLQQTPRHPLNPDEPSREAVAQNNSTPGVVKG
jgi:hypothetical protein